MPEVGEKGKGDLFVVVEARTPTELSDRERALLLELAKLPQSHGRNDIHKEQKPGSRDV